MSVKTYIQAARLRTLPLAVAGTITGNLLAYAETGQLRPAVFVLSVLTAVFLQILSNFANDYGDFVNGADDHTRTDRVMASGRLSKSHMKIAIGILILLCLSSGIALLLTGFGETGLAFYAMLGLGLAGITAAYFYTAGKRPYGYIGLGDLAVFIFFGPVAVSGTYFLQTGSPGTHIWWVSAAIGLLSTGVLNVNNIRDLESDRSKNKITLAVRFGYKNALLYQLILLNVAVLLITFYSYTSMSLSIVLLTNYAIFSLLFYLHYESLRSCHTRDDYNKQLKFLSLLILGMMLYFCLSEILFRSIGINSNNI